MFSGHGERISQAYGSSLPGPIWCEAMNEALEDEPEEAFAEP
jgi:membrane carboxypeptidase/penicillin-binding protein